MIGFINGRIVKVLDNGVLLDHNGMGFIIYTSMTSLASLSRTDEVTVYTYMYVREDQIELYGFASLEERDLFTKLISVSGVGPKGAINIMSNGSAETIKAAIVAGDESAIKATGVGKKTVQKVILELKDKLIKEGVNADLTFDSDDDMASSAKSDAILALISLGYDRQSATKAVKKVNNAADMTTEDVLKEALKLII
ncbi:MAG: Holliday junction branch migration protein RuvA [Lachnospiraceae bacterium]|nr:Holliday junction branch migration protein RuvA [Lachnospiraceae bacterium]